MSNYAKTVFRLQDNLALNKGADLSELGIAQESVIRQHVNKSTQLGKLLMAGGDSVSTVLIDVLKESLEFERTYLYWNDSIIDSANHFGVTTEGAIYIFRYRPPIFNEGTASKPNYVRHDIVDVAVNICKCSLVDISVSFDCGALSKALDRKVVGYDFDWTRPSFKPEIKEVDGGFEDTVTAMAAVGLLFLDNILETLTKVQLAEVVNRCEWEGRDDLIGILASNNVVLELK